MNPVKGIRNEDEIKQFLINRGVAANKRLASFVPGVCNEDCHFDVINSQLIYIGRLGT